MLQSRHLTNKDHFLIDFYRGPVIEKVRLQGLEHVLQFTAVDDKIYLRSYRYELTTALLSFACHVCMYSTYGIDLLVWDFVNDHKCFSSFWKPWFSQTTFLLSVIIVSKAFKIHCRFTCDCTTAPEKSLNLFQSVAEEIRKPYSTSWGWRNGPITRLGVKKNAFGIRWFNESCYKNTKGGEGMQETSFMIGHHCKAHTCPF